MRIWLNVILLGLAVIPVQVSAQVGKLLPVDEAPQDSSFLAFRTDLLAAIERQDTTFVLSRLSRPYFLNGFGGTNTATDFEEVWFGEDSSEELWPVLEEVLLLGGSFKGHRLDDRGVEVPSVFEAPYVWSAFPNGFDGYVHGVVIGEEVPVRASTESDATVLTILSFDVVEVSRWSLWDWDAGRVVPWVEVTLDGGSIGYVAQADIRSAIDWRVRFEFRDGRWLMTGLWAGD